MICYAYCWCEVFYFEQCNMYSLTQLELLRIKLNRTCFVLFLVVVVHHACRPPLFFYYYYYIIIIFLHLLLPVVVAVH